ncbi:MAG: hypothetical protein IIU35_03320 [Neisseriaceae bacterium]|nr:hypothetical protein [Neisseriaceae bacterium]
MPTRFYKVFRLPERFICIYFTFRPQCGRNVLTTGEILNCEHSAFVFIFSGCLKNISAVMVGWEAHPTVLFFLPLLPFQMRFEWR